MLIYESRSWHARIIADDRASLGRSRVASCAGSARFLSGSKLKTFDLAAANPMWSQDGYDTEFYDADPVRSGLRRCVVISVSSEAVPRMARGRRGSRARRRSSAARLTGPARPSTPMTRLRRQAMTLGPAPVRTCEVSSAKVTSRSWCSASIAQWLRAGRPAGRGGPGRG